MTSLHPSPEVEQALRTWFLGYGFAQRPELERLLAQALQTLPSGRDVVSVLRELDDRVRVWLARIAPTLAADLPAARAAWLGCAGPSRWPEAFLGTAVPNELAAALNGAVLRPLPMPAPTPMIEQSLAPVGWFGRLRELLEEPAPSLTPWDPTA